MNHYKFLLLPCLAASFLYLSGCGEKLPPGMPKLYRTTITITQDGNPLEGAHVIVVNDDFASQPWSAGGVTSSSGSIDLKTEGKYPGVPAGTYRVTVRKTEGPPGVELPKNLSTDEEIQEYDRIIKQIQENSFDVVDEKFMELQNTPLKLEVNGVTNQTFDVSPAVKNKIQLGPSA